MVVPPHTGLWWHAWLCPDRRQSSPRRILALPSDPVCSMLKARAMMGSGSGRGRRVRVWSNCCSGTVWHGNQVGAWKGPAIRPCRTSVAISSAIICQCVSVWLRRSFFWMYVWLCCRKSASETGWVYLVSVRTCQLTPG